MTPDPRITAHPGIVLADDELDRRINAWLRRRFAPPPAPALPFRGSCEAVRVDEERPANVASMRVFLARWVQQK